MAAKFQMKMRSTYVLLLLHYYYSGVTTDCAQQHINATLHVYPQKVEETAQKEAYRKYKQYMKDTGSYLLV